MSVPLVTDCPDCSDGECYSYTPSYGSDISGPFPCSECRGQGWVLVLCVVPGCGKEADVEPENGDPVCRYHHEHCSCDGLLIGPSYVWCPTCDRCQLCSQHPVETDDGHCARCAEHLAAVVAPVRGAA